jgi:TMEM175 potassium channel family protein
MDTESEHLPIDEQTSVERKTNTIPLGGQAAAPTSRIHRITHVLEGIQPTPGSNITRIFALSDCVIAVAFTLFVVNIHLPPDGLNESQLQNFISHNILSGEMPFYLVTYILVASSWISHYRIFTYLKRSNSLFIILNVLFLASIVFLPIPVAFFYRFGNQMGSLLIFACTQLVTSVTLLLMWVVARYDHLLDSALPSKYRSYTTARLLVIPIGTLFAIGIAFYNVWLAEVIFLCFYVLGWFLRGFFYRRHQREDYQEGTIRMCSITDNMTAVAFTFLITTITSVVLSSNQQSISSALTAVLAELPIYGLSLLIVGFYWLSHHRIYMVIRRHNMTLIWLNFAFLLLIELQPIFNSLRASYPTSQTTSILYALEQVATGLMLLIIWGYAARRHQLIDQTMGRFEIMVFAFRALLIPMIFLLSIAIILFSNDLAFYFWLLVIVLEIADLVYRRNRHRTHADTQRWVSAE